MPSSATFICVNHSEPEISNFLVNFVADRIEGENALTKKGKKNKTSRGYEP